MNARSQRGVAIVEFALILPMLLVLSFMTTEFGRALYQYNTLTKAARDAARYLSVQTPNTRLAEARNLMLYGSTSAGSTPLVPGLTAAMIPDATWQTAGSDPVINTVTVQIHGCGSTSDGSACYSFRSLFTTAFGQTFGTIPFSTITATMRSHL